MRSTTTHRCVGGNEVLDTVGFYEGGEESHGNTHKPHTHHQLQTPQSATIFFWLAIQKAAGLHDFYLKYISVEGKTKTCITRAHHTTQQIPGNKQHV